MLCSCFFSYSVRRGGRYSYSYSNQSSIAIRPIGPQVAANCLDQRSASPQFKQPSSTSKTKSDAMDEQVLRGLCEDQP
jgi:hypothetical protein